MGEKLKVVFVTMDEPYYIPQYIQNIFNNLGGNVEAVKVYALPPNMQKNSFIKTSYDFFSYFGSIVFSYMVILKVVYSVSDFINNIFNINNRVHSVKLVCSKFGIPFMRTSSINSISVLDDLRRIEPDIIFSVACPQIFSKNLISIPSRGSLNIHSSLLPQYRGLNANFWVMAKGEKVTGVTIHYVSPGIDDGDIVLQEKIVIEDNWSLHQLYLAAIGVGSQMIFRCLELIESGSVTTDKNDISKGVYYTFPTREDVKEFRFRKRRFFKYY